MNVCFFEYFTQMFVKTSGLVYRDGCLKFGFKPNFLDIHKAMRRLNLTLANLEQKPPSHVFKHLRLSSSLNILTPFSSLKTSFENQALGALKHKKKAQTTAQMHHMSLSCSMIAKIFRINERAAVAARSFMRKTSLQINIYDLGHLGLFDRKTDYYGWNKLLLCKYQMPISKRKPFLNKKYIIKWPFYYIFSVLRFSLKFKKIRKTENK